MNRNPADATQDGAHPANGLRREEKGDHVELNLINNINSDAPASPTADAVMERALRMLSTAFSFDEVERCPSPCVACDGRMPTAA